jgi:hypothetical protein
MRLATIILAFASGVIFGALIGHNVKPKKNTVVIYHKYGKPKVINPKKKDSLQPLIKAIIHVESHGNDSAVNVSSQAVGCMQIRPIMVREVNRILKIKNRSERYNLSHRYNRKKSIEMFHIWREYHHKSDTWENIARCWNGGGKGHVMASTVGYWNKVRNQINETNSATKSTN